MLRIEYIFSKDKKLISSLKNITGFYPGNISLYKLAFSHRSLARDGGIKSNERLEYLGDAILGAVIADLLFKKFPYRDEGFLTEMRSKIVSRESLRNIAIRAGIDKVVQISPGITSGRSVCGNALEALIGAIYMDKGFKTVQQFIHKQIIHLHVDINKLETEEKNFKSKILNWAQRVKKTAAFETLLEDQNRLIKVRLLINNEELATGQDFSKKKAEQIAAENACILLGL